MPNRKFHLSEDRRVSKQTSTQKMDGNETVYFVPRNTQKAADDHAFWLIKHGYITRMCIAQNMSYYKSNLRY
jgi:hypothetical protein